MSAPSTALTDCCTQVCPSLECLRPLPPSRTAVHRSVPVWSVCALYRPHGLLYTGLSQSGVSAPSTALTDCCTQVCPSLECLRPLPPSRTAVHRSVPVWSVCALYGPHGLLYTGLSQSGVSAPSTALTDCCTQVCPSLECLRPLPPSRTAVHRSVPVWSVCALYRPHGLLYTGLSQSGVSAPSTALTDCCTQVCPSLECLHPLPPSRTAVHRSVPVWSVCALYRPHGLLYTGLFPVWSVCALYRPHGPLYTGLSQSGVSAPSTALTDCCTQVCPSLECLRPQLLTEVVSNQPSQGLFPVWSVCALYRPHGPLYTGLSQSGVSAPSTALTDCCTQVCSQSGVSAPSTALTDRCTQVCPSLECLRPLPPSRTAVHRSVPVWSVCALYRPHGLLYTGLSQSGVSAPSTALTDCCTQVCSQSGVSAPYTALTDRCTQVCPSLECLRPLPPSRTAVHRSVPSLECLRPLPPSRTAVHRSVPVWSVCALYRPHGLLYTGLFPVWSVCALYRPHGPLYTGLSQSGVSAPSTALTDCCTQVCSQSGVSAPSTALTDRCTQVCPSLECLRPLPPSRTAVHRSVPVWSVCAPNY